jgi:hypothetical protein
MLCGGIVFVQNVVKEEMRPQLKYNNNFWDRLEEHTPMFVQENL